jgi:hypothetical protein
MELYMDDIPSHRRGHPARSSLLYRSFAMTREVMNFETLYGVICLIAGTGAALYWLLETYPRHIKHLKEWWLEHAQRRS